MYTCYMHVSYVCVMYTCYMYVSYVYVICIRVMYVICIYLSYMYVICGCMFVALWVQEMGLRPARKIGGIQPPSPQERHVGRRRGGAIFAGLLWTLGSVKYCMVTGVNPT